VVLHEDGHWLDFAHEHSSPDAGIPWDRPAVYAYHARVDSWSQTQVDRQVFYKYSVSQTQFSDFDPESIMEYPVPNALTIGDYEIGWNTKRSETDRKYAQIWYQS
jgi:serralysin